MTVLFGSAVAAGYGAIYTKQEEGCQAGNFAHFARKFRLTVTRRGATPSRFARLGEASSANGARRTSVERRMRTTTGVLDKLLMSMMVLLLAQGAASAAPPSEQDAKQWLAMPKGSTSLGRTSEG